MRIVLLLLIRLYWAVISKSKRRRCLFRTTCSQYVFRVTRQEGLYKGLMALKYRFVNCRGGFHIFEHPVNGCKIMVLPNGQAIDEKEIAERLLK
jgi:putative component of membrane protein insertase Oxa1/YidC/SpoIIIJ protein YidD